MKHLNWLFTLAIAAAALLAGCGKSANTNNPSSITVNGVAVESPKLQQALATSTAPEVQTDLADFAFGMRYSDYPKAVAALGKLANESSLTEAQKQLATKVADQLKQALSQAPQPK